MEPGPDGREMAFGETPFLSAAHVGVAHSTIAPPSNNNGSARYWVGVGPKALNDMPPSYRQRPTLNHTPLVAGWGSRPEQPVTGKFKMGSPFSICTSETALNCSRQPASAKIASNHEG